MTTHRWRTITAAIAATALLLGACGNDDGSPTASPTPVETGETDPTSVEDVERPVVVASTSWVAALATAAGIEDVTIVAPVDLQHPPDYDPRPSDLAAIADADVVLLAGFEGFAERMTDAVDSDAEVISLDVDNQPDTIRTNVRLLAETFGTQDAAEAWIETFDERVAELQAELAQARPDETPTAVAHVFMTYWGDFAGIDVVGTYGPQPASAGELAELTAADPDLILTNAHVPAGATFDDLAGEQVAITNFPGPSLDLVEVFEANTAAIIAALSSS